MIDQVDEALRKWAATVLDSDVVTFEPPNNSLDELSIHLYLIELVDCPPSRGGIGSPPLQFSLRYLVTTSLGQPARAHGLLGQVAFAAMETPNYEVEFHALDPSFWLAMGTVPRPSFFLNVPVRKERTEPTTRVVLHPPVVNVSSITTLRGVVMGPGDVPWVGALVEMPAVGRSVYADLKGHFKFDAIPAEPRAKALRISGKGQVFEVEVEQPAQPNDEVEVRLDP